MELESYAEFSRLIHSTVNASRIPSVGEAARLAKYSATDPDVRKSWIFFGDPSMKLR